jgi:hypothetical protein
MLRVDFDRPAVVRDGPVDFAFIAVGSAAIVVSIGILRIDLDCLGEI